MADETTVNAADLGALGILRLHVRGRDEPSYVRADQIAGILADVVDEHGEAVTVAVVLLVGADEPIRLRGQVETVCQEWVRGLMALREWEMAVAARAAGSLS